MHMGREGANRSVSVMGEESGLSGLSLGMSPTNHITIVRPLLEESSFANGMGNSSPT